MNWPTYPVQNSGIGRLYEAFRVAGADGLDRVTMARIFYGVAEPTPKQVDNISSGNARLREWLARHDLTIVPNTRMGQRATRFRVQARRPAEPSSPVEPATDRSPHARKVIAGHVISLPRLSILDGLSGEAHPC